MMTRDIRATYGILSRGTRKGAGDTMTEKQPLDCIEAPRGGAQAEEDDGERVYGVNHFRASLHICLPDPPKLQGHVGSPDVTAKAAPLGGVKIIETLIVKPRLGHVSVTVCSQVEVIEHRRHRDEVSFRFVMSSVKCADTAYVYPNSTKKRYVNQVCCEPRIKSTHFSDTLFAFPASLQDRYTTTMECNVRKHNKRYKTTLEIGARDTKSSHRHIPHTEIASDVSTSHLSQSACARSSRMPNGLSFDFIPDKNAKAVGDVNNNEEGMDRGKGKPWASQVLIPKRRMYEVDRRVFIIE